eukprot:4275648-Pyramimonas_sp.AAC.1
MDRTPCKRSREFMWSTVWVLAMADHNTLEGPCLLAKICLRSERWGNHGEKSGTRKTRNVLRKQLGNANLYFTYAKHLEKHWLNSVDLSCQRDPKARRLKYLFAQTDIFSHFMKGGPDDS